MIDAVSPFRGNSVRVIGSLVGFVAVIALTVWSVPVDAQMPDPGQGQQLQPPQLGEPQEPAPAPPQEVTTPEGELAQEGQTIVEVQVSGNRRVEADSIIDRVQTTAGDALNRQQITDDIRRIFELGYFDDIQVLATQVDDQQVVLTFVVSEKPAIDAIEFVGNDALSTEDLMEVVELRRFSILDISRINRSAAAIRDLYHEEGYFLAEVDFEVQVRADREDLAVVTFEIREYAKVEVKRVTILGNEAVPDSELQNIMATRPGNVLSFLTQMGSFQEDDFEDDLQRLVAYYYTMGYIQVNVEMPTIRLSPDKRYLYITVRIEEGPQHKTGNVDVSGDLLIEREELLEMLQIVEEEIFRYDVLQQDMMRISRLYQDAGYANVRVNPLTPHLDPETHTMDVTFDIQRGERVHLGRIEVVGNTKTRDQVIRRELQIEEGDLFSASAIERSQRRIERLGYFEAVNVTTQQTQTPEVMDLRIEVEEMPTGSFQLGAGLSSQENFIFQGQVSQENLFGRGQSLQLSVQASSIRQLFNLRFAEPRLFGSQWHFATDLYNFDFRYQDFDRLSRGGTLSFGYPIGELLGLEVGDALTASLRYKLENVTVTPGGLTGTVEQPSSPLFTDGLTSSLRLGTAFDTRDNRLFPTRGQYHTGSVEVADSLTLSQNQFIKFDTDARYYQPLWWNFVLRLNASLGFVASTSPDRPVPIFERYFVGGPETVRGFERYTLGPSRRSPTDMGDPTGVLRDFHYGGNKKLILTTEIEFPIFAAAQVKGVIFADAGNAFDDGDPFTLQLDLVADDDEMFANALRTSVGVGVRWFSPIGPLRFEWGVPLRRLPGERPVVFDFSITQAF